MEDGLCVQQPARRQRAGVSRDKSARDDLEDVIPDLDGCTALSELEKDGIRAHRTVKNVNGCATYDRLRPPPPCCLFAFGSRKHFFRCVSKSLRS